MNICEGSFVKVVSAILLNIELVLEPTAEKMEKRWVKSRNKAAWLGVTWFCVYILLFLEQAPGHLRS